MKVSDARRLKAQEDENAKLNKLSRTLPRMPLPALFRLIETLGYAGWLGAEYHLRGRTEDGFGDLQRGA